MVVIRSSCIAPADKKLTRVLYANSLEVHTTFVIFGPSTTPSSRVSLSWGPQPVPAASPSRGVRVSVLHSGFSLLLSRQAPRLWPTKGSCTAYISLSRMRVLDGVDLERRCSFPTQY